MLGRPWLTCSGSQIIELFQSYFNVVDEDSLRNNFVLIYELLDGARLAGVTHSHWLTRAGAEVMDNGYPQVLLPEALKLYITQEGVRSDLAPHDIRVRPRKAPEQPGPTLTLRRRDEPPSRATRRCR